jgi:hypothetical protein
VAPRTLEEILASVEEITGKLAAQAAQMNNPVDPLAAVAAAFESRAWAEKHLADRIADARAAGCSWASIGAMLGTSGEAARQRYGKRQ